MDTLNKLFQMKCVFLIVTCLLGDAHFQWLDDGESFGQAAEFLDECVIHRSIREVEQGSPSNYSVSESNSGIFSINASTDNASSTHNDTIDVATAASTIEPINSNPTNETLLESSVSTTRSMPIYDAVNKPQESISSTTETSVLTSILPPNIDNTTSSTSQLETSSKEPDDEVSVTQQSPEKTTLPSVPTRNPNTDDSSLFSRTASSKFDDIDGTQIDISSSNETIVFSTLTLNANTDRATSLPPTDENISSAKDSNPDTENTTFLPGASSSESKGDDIVPKIDSNRSLNDISFAFTSVPVIETTSPSAIPALIKPSHIMKILKKTEISVLDTSSGSSTDDELAGLSNTNSNSESQIDMNPPANQASVTEKLANSKGEQIKANETSCSSLRTSLTDSISNTFVDFLEQLVGFFLNALDETFDQIFEPSMPPLLDKIGLFLDAVRIDVDEDVKGLANSTLATVLEKKLAAFGKFETFNRFVNGSQQAAEVNDTIFGMFNSIDLWLNEFSQPESLNSTLLDLNLLNISTLLNHTVNGFLRSVNEVAAGQVVESPIAKNSSADMTQLVDDFLSNRAAQFEKFFNANESFTEPIDDLMRITRKYQNTFVKDIDSLLVDSLIQVNDENGSVFDELLENISLVLQHLRQNLLEAKITRWKNLAISTKLDQIEKSLLKIENAMTPLHAEYILHHNLSIPEFVDSISNPVRDAINARKQVFDLLKNMSETTNEGSVNAAYSLIKDSLYETILNLQKEVPPLLDMHFFKSSSCLNMSSLSSTYDRILKDYSKKLYTCENSRGDQHNEDNVTDDPSSKTKFSTSRGIFTLPFEYLLVFTVLINYLVMW